MEKNIPRAADIMTRKVITLSPDMGVLEAMRLFVEHKISGAPVLDDDGALVGVFTEYDCLRTLASGQFADEAQDESEPVGQVMTREVVTIPSELELFAVAHRFLDRPVRRLPVVDDGKLVGLVSRRDVLEGIDRMRRELREIHKPPAENKPPALYLSASDPDGDEISSRLDSRDRDEPES